MTGSRRVLARGLVFGLPALIAVGLTLGGCPIFNPTPEPNDANTTPEPNNTTGNSGVTGKFRSATVCAQCHNTLHANWAATDHSKALEDLEAIGQGTNAVCLACHTVGFGQPGGFVDRATTNALAGVQCENCHGPAGDHVANVSDLSKLPKIDIAGDVCGACHTDTHHPTFEEWQTSAHATAAISNREVLDEMADGTNAQSCGKCHSGDYFYLAILGGNATYTAGGFPGHPVTIGQDYFKGQDPNTLNVITCAICHDPHMRTGNASTPENGRDYQLRYAEVKAVTPTNTLAATTDPARFNICGQCHHARERTWWQTGTSTREPHPSNQANFYFGEMPLDPNDPNGGTPLVASRVSIHISTPDQCATCHVYRQAGSDTGQVTISGHTFEVAYSGCVASGCHATAEGAETLAVGIKGETKSRLDTLKAALDNWSARKGHGWNYSSQPGGPGYKDPVTGVTVPGAQKKIPPDIQKARFMYYYAMEGSGWGVHNPNYMRDMLGAAQLYVAKDPNLLP